MTDLETFVAILDGCGLHYSLYVIATVSGPQQVLAPDGYRFEFWFLNGGMVATFEPLSGHMCGRDQWE